MSGDACEAEGPPRERDRRLVDRMLALFELEEVAPCRYLAPGARTEPRRTFGGQLVAQALAAATRTVEPQRRVHSLHAYFLQAGMTTKDSHLCVAADRDGSIHSVRRVMLTQDGRLLLSLSANFQTATGGALQHQVPMPSVPMPEVLEDDHARAHDHGGLSATAKAMLERASPFQFRSTDPEARFSNRPAPARQRYWFRTARSLGVADQGLQRIILAYASDTMLLGAALMPHGLRWFDGGARVASLDHSVWIHGDVQVDDWLLYDQESPWAGEGRGLVRGHIFDRHGRLVATVSQEGSMRPIDLAGEVEKHSG